MSQDYEELLGVQHAQHAEELREKDEALGRLHQAVQELSAVVRRAHDLRRQKFRNPRQRCTTDAQTTRNKPLDTYRR